MAFVYIVMDGSDNNKIVEVFTSLRETQIYIEKHNKLVDNLWYEDWQVDL